MPKSTPDRTFTAHLPVRYSRANLQGDCILSKIPSSQLPIPFHIVDVSQVEKKRARTYIRECKAVNFGGCAGYSLTSMALAC